MKILSMLTAALVAVSAIVSIARAEQVPVHGFTAAESAKMAEANAKTAQGQTALDNLFINSPIHMSEVNDKRRPYAEYETAGYLLFSEHGEFNSAAAKAAMAKNLPANMTLVVYTGNAGKNYQKNLFSTYSQYVPKNRLKVVYLSGAGKGFWARDGIPVPIWETKADGSQKFSVVDAKYYHSFEADKEVANFFSAGLVQLPYYTEGGNFMNNTKGDCVVVNNERVAIIPDSAYQDKYGCKTLLRLAYIKGIGHIDESLKFVDDDTVLTDTPEYVNFLQNAGFEVIMLPRPNNKYETYANAMVANGTAFLPIFNQTQDKKAIEIYENLGLKVVPLNSIKLSNEGLGSIHCITMTYPPVPFNQLLEHVGGEEVK